MFTRLAEFRLVQSRRIAPRLREAVAHSNDNLPGLRRPAAPGRRRSPTPALACHWFVRSGRLECRWQVETDDGDLRPGFGSGAFSSEVETGSRQENASNQESRAPFRFHRNGKGSSDATLLHRSPRRDLRSSTLAAGA